MAERRRGLTLLMRLEAFLTAWKNGVSEVYLKLPLFFSKDALYSLCYQQMNLLLVTLKIVLCTTKKAYLPLELNVLYGIFYSMK